MSRFDECLKFVLGREGGTSNDPNDAGGLTAALEKALPAVLGALGVREQARYNMWQAIVVGGIGAAAGVIGTWLSIGK